MKVLAVNINAKNLVTAKRVWNVFSVNKSNAEEGEDWRVWVSEKEGGDGIAVQAEGLPTVGVLTPFSA